MTYTPRPGSIAGKALEFVSLHGETAAAPLADAIDASFVGFDDACEYAVRMGALAMRKRLGISYYRIGSGEPMKRRWTDEPDSSPMQQRVVPAVDRRCTVDAGVLSMEIEIARRRRHV